MTLQEFAQIGSMVGATAAVMSIIYGSIQIRNNTRAIRASAFQQAAASVVSQIDALARDGELCEIVLRGGDDFSGLQRVEKARFLFNQQGFVRRAENIWMQTRLGTLDAPIWIGIRDALANFFSAPGQRDAWALIRLRINAEFRAEVDGIVQEQATNALT